MVNVLILSATASAINYINSLNNRRELRLYFTDISPYASGLYNNNVTGLVIPAARKEEAYLETLERIIMEHSIDILIPTSDHDVEGIMLLLKQGWNPKVKMFKPDYQTYFTFSHKRLLIEKLSQFSFPIPQIYETFKKVKFPAIIKPTREGGSKGVFIINNILELEEKYIEINKIFKEVIIQEYIPGETGSIYVVLLLYGNDGKLYGEAVSHSHLTFYTWGGGGGNAGIMVDEPMLLEQAKNIVTACGGWYGPINLEFKRHEKNGKFYLMEVNCRLNGYSYLTSMNGLNFPAAIIDLLTKGTTEYLSLNKEKTFNNFLIAYHEKPIDAWIGQ